MITCSFEITASIRNRHVGVSQTHPNERVLRACFSQNVSDTFAVDCGSSDDTFFRRVIGDEYHPLQHLFFPPELPRSYNIRSRFHDFFQHNFWIKPNVPK